MNINEQSAPLTDFKSRYVQPNTARKMVIFVQRLLWTVILTCKRLLNMTQMVVCGPTTIEHSNLAPRFDNGRIRLSLSTASRTCELSEETHVTPFRTYRFHSTGLCNYKP